MSMYIRYEGATRDKPWLRWLTLAAGLGVFALSAVFGFFILAGVALLAVLALGIQWLRVKMGWLSPREKQVFEMMQAMKTQADQMKQAASQAHKPPKHESQGEVLDASYRVVDADGDDV